MRELTKVLHLVEPEELQALNILDPVESPVFISPYWLHTAPCLTCEATIGPLIYALGHETTTRHNSPTCPGIFVSAHAGAAQSISPWLAAAVGHNQLTKHDADWQQGYGLETYTSITLTSLLGFCMFCLAPCNSPSTQLIKQPITSNMQHVVISTLWPVHDKCLPKMLGMSPINPALSEVIVSEWRYNAQSNTFFRPSLEPLTIPPVFSY
jgi:hypothetical protein